MTRRLVIEVEGDDLPHALIDGLEFAGLRVGAKLRVRELDEDSAITQIQTVITSNTLPGPVHHRDDCTLKCDCGRGEQGVEGHARDCALPTGHCGCGPTSWEIAALALADALKYGQVSPT